MSQKVRLSVSLLLFLVFGAFLTVLPTVAHEQNSGPEIEALVVQDESVEKQAALDSEVEKGLFGQELSVLQLPELSPHTQEAAGGNGCFPPSFPPPSCECSSCCECNKCWNNGVIVRVPCDN